MYPRGVRPSASHRVRALVRVAVGLALLAVGVAVWRSGGHGDLATDVESKALGFPIAGIGALLVLMELFQCLFASAGDDDGAPGSALPVATVRQRRRPRS